MQRVRQVWDVSATPHHQAIFVLRSAVKAQVLNQAGSSVKGEVTEGHCALLQDAVTNRITPNVTGFRVSGIQVGFQEFR